MLRLGQFTAWISIEGLQRDIYDPQVSADGNGSTCWIASEAGKTFSVNWRNDLRDTAIQAVVEIDGVMCNQHVMLDALNFPDKPNAIGIWYSRTSDYTRRDFVFSPIEITDDDAYLYTLGNTLQFGIIQLQLWRLHVTDVASRPIAHRPGGPTLEDQILHERSKKAGAHHVKFGEEYMSPLPTVDAVDGYRTDTAPWATFTFKYRPLDMLMANGIVPRPMKQLLATPVKQESDAATAEEIRKLEARLKALRSETVIPNRGGPSRTRSVKMEPTSSSGNFAEREVIDLT